MRQVFGKLKTPLTLIILLVILFVGFMWGWKQVTAPMPTTPPDPCVNQPVKNGRLTADLVTVRIYNSGNVSGRATKIATDLRAKGFRVTSVSNKEPLIEKTTITGSSENNPEVKLVAGFFADAEIKADGRVDNSVDVVVGNTYGGFNAKAATSIAVEGTQVCLPSPTPTAVA